MNKEAIKTLFMYVRKSIKSRFNDAEFKPTKIPLAIKSKHGVFVTLTINDSLRGCIGIIKPIPLWEGVISAARSSAFSDPRFIPLSEEEYKQISIEISILSKPVKVTRDEIKKGDGLIVNKGYRSALFLPQVWDQLPEKEEFINQLFMKAGLSPGEGGVTYEKFSVEAWKEVNGKISQV